MIENRFIFNFPKKELVWYDHERHTQLLFSGQHRISFVLVRLIKSSEAEIAIILNHFYATHRNMKYTNMYVLVRDKIKIQNFTLKNKVKHHVYPTKVVYSRFLWSFSKWKMIEETVRISYNGF